MSVNTRPDRCPSCDARDAGEGKAFEELARVEGDITISTGDEILYLCRTCSHEFSWGDGDDLTGTSLAAAGVTRRPSDVDGEPVPKRVQEAEERREFRELLRAAIPVTDEDIRAIATGQCQPCRNDQCGDAGCALPTGCACTCTAEKLTLAQQIYDAINQLGMWFNMDDLTEIADALYREGWRRG